MYCRRSPRKLKECPLKILRKKLRVSGLPGSSGIAGHESISHSLQCYKKSDVSLQAIDLKNMANYNPKGIERMRLLGRAGGTKSGETRRLNAFTLRMAAVYPVWEAANKRGIRDDEIWKALERVDKRGGSHDSDWRCPHCHAFNSIKSRACSKCLAFAPRNGRLTRAAITEHIAQSNADHKLKHGL
jgi:hypothetical protein